MKEEQTVHILTEGDAHRLVNLITQLNLAVSEFLEKRIHRLDKDQYDCGVEQTKMWEQTVDLNIF